MNKSTLTLLLIGFTMPAFAQNIGMGLVKAVQEQQHIIDELRKKVDALEKKSKQS